MAKADATYYIDTPRGFVMRFDERTKIVSYTSATALRATFHSLETAKSYAMGIEGARVLPLRKEHRGRPARGFHNPD